MKLINETYQFKVLATPQEAPTKLNAAIMNPSEMEREKETFRN
jgi:hypothetical protein